MPAGTPGLIVEPPYRKMGWHASDTHGLVFDGCRVPAANLLGERGQGFRNFLAILDDGRVAIAALAVGLAQGLAIEPAVERARLYVQRAIASAPGLGHGHGPLDHAHPLRSHS